MDYAKLGKHLLLPLAIVISCLPLFNPFNIFSDLRNSAFDIFQTISPRQSLSNNSIIVIDIDDESLQKIGQWPWPRNVVSKLVEKTKLSAVTAFDIVFAEPDRTGSKELKKLYKENKNLLKALDTQINNDDIFATSIQQHRTVVLGSAPNNSESMTDINNKFGLVLQGDDPKLFLPKFKSIQSNLEILEKNAAGIGSMSIGNNDSIIRKLPSFENINGELIASLPLEILRVAIGASTYQIKSSNASGENAFGENTGINHIKLSNLIIPTNADGSIWIHYSNNLIKKISAWEVLSDQTNLNSFKDKIIIVGTSASGLFDLRSTPLNNNVPGVNIIAQLTDQILTGHFLKRPDWIYGAELLSGLILALLITITIQRLGPVGGLLVFVGGNFISIYGSYYLFNSLKYLVDPVSPLIICLFAYLIITFFNFLFTELERSKVRTAFSQYLSPEMVSKLAKSSKTLKLGGEKKYMTFLFSDIRGFTSISERYKTKPEELTDLINKLLTVLSDEILKFEGTIDKYMGDCVMAFWNAPSEDPQHKLKALKAAFNMSNSINKLNHELNMNGEDILQIGIGINSGDCVVGNMGSNKRFDYTVLGDSVNLASRLEGQSSNYGMQVILGEETVDNTIIDEFHLFELDLISVKGKSEPVKIFTAFESLSFEIILEEFMTEHEEFLKNYRNQKWPEALSHIEKYKFSVPEFTLYYTLFFDRIKNLIENKPDKDWSGVYVAKDK